MKYLRFNILLMLFCCSISCSTQEKKLLWEENFNGDKLDEKVWNFELGDGCPNLCGWGNAEKQIYTKKNHKVANGHLIIELRNEDKKYTSTRITTKGKKEFKYGYIETRAKLPRGKGVWPAFWMLGKNISNVGWPVCGEIDILEYVGKEPNTIFTSLHTKASHGNTINTKRTVVKNVEDDFHTYAINWNKEKIEFYIDNNLVYTFEPKDKTTEHWPYKQPFYFILNLAVGGHFGGPDIDDSIFPQQFVIDYIKVYE
jgi:beta-glucanase (GH16 family)